MRYYSERGASLPLIDPERSDMVRGIIRWSQSDDLHVISLRRLSSGCLLSMVGMAS